MVINIVKIKKNNPAELLTKHLSKDEIAQIVHALCHDFSDGRIQDAPELAMVSEIMDWSMLKKAMFGLKLWGWPPVDKTAERTLPHL